jgi:hypothetical protein
LTDYTPCDPVGCGYSPNGECDLHRAQVEMADKMKIVERIGKYKGGVINAFYKPGQGWLITIKAR